MIVQTSTVAN